MAVYPGSPTDAGSRQTRGCQREVQRGDGERRGDYQVAPHRKVGVITLMDGGTE